jgi:hypothetical protein
MSQIEDKTCTLRRSAHGLSERCSRDHCSFWEPGGAVLEGGCFVERLGIDLKRRDLATYLLDTLARLDQARNLAQAEKAHRQFSRRVGLEL